MPTPRTAYENAANLFICLNIVSSMHCQTNPVFLGAVVILVPRAHDPSGLWQGSRALAGTDFLSMRRPFVSYSRPIRFDGKSVNRGLPVLDEARALRRYVMYGDIYCTEVYISYIYTSLTREACLTGVAFFSFLRSLSYLSGLTDLRCLSYLSCLSYLRCFSYLSCLSYLRCLTYLRYFTSVK